MVTQALMLPRTRGILMACASQPLMPNTALQLDLRGTHAIEQHDATIPVGAIDLPAGFRDLTVRALG